MLINFYSTCCVDEHTASTISVGGIIHFGHACLSPHSLLPVLYVYGNQELQEDSLLHAMNGLLLEANTILLSCDVAYYEALSTIQQHLQRLRLNNSFIIKFDFSRKTVS